MGENILEVKNLVKNYGEYCAVNRISFNVTKGKVIGLLGPNGAGKTTTIQVLLGITLANGGSVKYFGKNFFKNREYCLQKINYTSSFNNLQGRITILENLLVYANLYNVKNPREKIKELTSYFEVVPILNKRYYDISSGHRTRVNLIKSLINDPEIILMDEPTASLDPDIADKLLLLIENLRKNKETSVLYTSHDMQEVARICDEVIFLDQGKIIAKDSPLGLTKRISKAQLKITFEGDRSRVEQYLVKENIKFNFQTKNILIIDSKEKDIPKLIFSLSKVGIWMTDIDIKKPTLEDFFLQIARKKND